MITHEGYDEPDSEKDTRRPPRLSSCVLELVNSLLVGPVGVSLKEEDEEDEEDEGE
jgi:hypothetical protein